MNDQNLSNTNGFTNPFIAREKAFRAAQAANPMNALSEQYKTISAPKRKRKKESLIDPIDAMAPLVSKYNDYIMANDLPDDLIEVRDYSNKNSPSYLDGKPFGINEEKKYLQNQLWKLQGDKNYVPDYEDLDNLSDDEYEQYMNKLTAPDANVTNDNSDKMSDEDFTDQLDEFIRREPQPRRRPGA